MRMCKICCLPAGRRAKIDAALVDGVTYKRIAAKFSTKMQPINSVNLCNHRKHLLPKDLVRKAPAPSPEVSATLLDRIEGLILQSRSIAHAAERSQQWVSATSALREVRCCIELLGKLTGELSSTTNVNFLLGSVTVERVAAFLDSIPKLGGTVLEEKVRAMVVQRFGIMPPHINVEFMDVEGAKATLTDIIAEATAKRDEATATNGHAPSNGHAPGVPLFLPEAEGDS